MEKETKVFNIGNKKYRFNSMMFQKLFNEKCKQEKIGPGDLEEKMANKIHISSSAVHSWRFGFTGPSDLTSITTISNLFDVSFGSLLHEVKENNMQITERQKDSLKRVYDSIIEYLNKFDETEGFTIYGEIFKKQGIHKDLIEGKVYDVADAEQRKVALVLQKEYIELYKLDVYSELQEYVNENLIDIYDGKIDFGYRFEAAVTNKDGTSTTVTLSEDYYQALNRINEIMEPYMG